MSMNDLPPKPAELTFAQLKEQSRAGRIKYSTDLLDQMSPSAIFLALGRGVITRVDSEFGSSGHADTLEFIIWSEQFRPVKRGEVIPEYQVTVDPHKQLPLFTEIPAGTNFCPACRTELKPTTVKSKTGMRRAWLCACVEEEPSFEVPE